MCGSKSNLHIIPHVPFKKLYTLKFRLQKERAQTWPSPAALTVTRRRSTGQLVAPLGACGWGCCHGNRAPQHAAVAPTILYRRTYYICMLYEFVGKTTATQVWTSTRALKIGHIHSLIFKNVHFVNTNVYIESYSNFIF